MPIIAETDFCKHGFEFAKQKQKDGFISACFNPVTLWFGKCTHSGQHSEECIHYFNNKAFFLPLTVCHSVVHGLPIDIQIGYICQLQSMQHLAFFAHRGSAQIRHACTETMTRVVRSKNSVNAKLLRNACKTSIVTKETLLLAKDKMIATSPIDLLCMSLYLNFMFLHKRMPYDFHPRTFLMARAVLAHFKIPAELQRIILQHVFSNSQGLFL